MYTYQCQACEYAWEDLVPYERIDEATKKPCPECKRKKVTRIFEMPLITYNQTTRKADGGWKDTLHKISSAHPQSELASQHLRKTNKQVKTEQIMKKHKRKK